ncbi:MAG: hypothetical protein JWS10_3492 [Cypionkella sp.]|uniref:hypothetical protein n=1 Tax=Cypionkella sp. TaxID=2811411 RepID=UPI0026334DD8|nr:hypothetical protein [Cypionkella sp.]MDB5660877.1 hypothetical protein [Cypionkella sp.]
MTNPLPESAMAGEYVLLKSIRDAAKRRLQDANKVENAIEWADAKRCFDVAQTAYGTLVARLMGRD